jgi:YVTN family beta-propeller protein
MSSARAGNNLKQFARAVQRPRLLASNAARAAARRTVSRFAVIALLASLALSFAATAQAQIPPQTVLGAGQFPNAVAVNPVTNKIYIANSGSNNVTVVDGATNTFTTITDIHATTPVAIAVNSLTNMVYVANSGSNNVSVFSGAVGSTPATYVTTITNGNGLAPSAIAVDANLNQVYVANSNSGNISIINGATNAITATRASGTTPSAIAVNSATGFFYVANAGDNTVAIFNGNTNVIAGSASMGSGANPSAIAVNEATDQIYVSNNGTNNVIQIDGGTQAVTGSPISNGNAINLQGIAVNPVTNQIFVAAGSGNTLVINAPANSTSLVNDPNASAGDAVTVDSITNTVYVANFNGTVTEFNGSNPSTVYNFATDGSTQAIAVNPATHRAYAACNLSNGAFTVIDGAALIPTTITPTDSAPVAIGVNPVTNFIYVANSGDNDVTVINGATNTIQGSAIGVGNNPTAIAVDPIRNQIYVLNTGDDFVTDIDGASGNTAQITDGSASGLNSITFNPVTNTGFFTGATSQTLTNFTTIFGVSTSTGDQSLSGFAPHPGPMAINPSNGQLFILDNADNSFTVLDAVTGNSATNGGSLNGFTAIAINPVTNFAYLAGPLGVQVVNGSDLSSNVVSDNNASGPIAIAVNPVTNLVYVANSTSKNVSVFQGATATSQASYLATVTDTFANNPQAIAVDPATNKIYVVNKGSNTITVIDGVSNAELSIPVGNSPVAVAANSISNQDYIVNQSDASVTAITEYQPQSNNLQTTISTFTGNATSTTTPTFTFSAMNTLSEKTPPPSPTFAPIANIYYQVDSWQGAWTPTKTQSGFSATLAPLSPGVHTIFAFATDGEDSTSTISGMQSGPTIGQIASYQFLVAPEIGQFFALFGANQDFGNQAEGVPSAAKAVTLENEGGAPMTFEFALSGPNAADFSLTTPSGTNCSQLGGTLPANSQCQFFYTFQPSTLGAETATVNVTDTSTGTPVALPIFTLTGTGVPQLSVTVTGSGSVTDGASFTCGSGTCTTTYAANASVTLTATPSSGSSFSGWGGDCSGNSTCVLTMSASHNVTAVFSSSGPQLSIGEAGNGTGTVMSSPVGIACQSTCGATFTMGQVVTLTAVANPGSTFIGWSGAGCSGTGTCNVTMNSAQTVVATFTSSSTTSCPATGTTNWIGGASGNWSVGTNWSTGSQPVSGAIVCIADGASGAHVVTVDVSPSVGGLYIDAGNTLTISANMTFVAAGTISNSGTIILNVTTGSNVVMTINGTVTLTGGGTITLSKGSSGSPILNNENNGLLINVNNTIQGAGQIGNNGLAFTNQAAGTVNANDIDGNTLTFSSTGAVVNQGLMEATGSGILQFNTTVNNQAANIESIGSGAQVALGNSADIQGGTLTSSSSGLMNTLASNGVNLDGSTHGALTIAGTYTEQANSTTVMSGTINNTGTIFLNVTTGSNVVMTFNSVVTLTGGGTINMSKASSGSPIFNNENNGALINVNNLIEGAGEIGNNGLLFTNEAAGVVNANTNNVNGAALVIDANGVVNQGLMEATNSGTLQLDVVVLNQNANIKSIGPGSLVTLVNATIEGGTITNSGGTFQNPASTGATLDGSSHGQITIVGTFTGQANSTTDLIGTINNTGIIDLNVNTGSNVVLTFNSVVTLTGGGTLLMDKQSSGNPILNNENNGQLLNVNNLIEGAGEIGNNGLILVNQPAGVINANNNSSAGNTLTIDTNTDTNQGLMEATGNGSLLINGITVINQGSNIEAIGANATVMFQSSTVQGGTLTNSGGLMETPPSVGVNLDGSTHGPLTLVGTYTMQANSTTDLIGTINNTGTILMNVNTGSNVVLTFNSVVTLTGGGTLLMDKQSSGNPILNNANNGQLINVNNLIEGAGEIGNNGLILINQAAGVINANNNSSAGNTLTIDTNTDTNQGLMEATGNGSLLINGITVINQGSNIEAIGANATVMFQSSTVQGGTLTNSGGLIETPVSVGMTLDGNTHGPLTLVGTYTMQANSTTDMVGTINNTGNLLMNCNTGSNIVITLVGNVTLTGGGTLTLSKTSSGNPILNNANNGTLINVNNVIQGAGEIGNNGLVLINQPAGIVNANSAGQTLTIDVSGPFNNSGLVETTGTGLLQFNTSVNNAGVIFPGGTLAAPSTINQSGGYTQTSTGALNVILFQGNGNPINSSYSTNNGASLSGALNLIYGSGYSPAPGDSFVVLRSDVVSSPFTTINSPSVPAGFAWLASYSNGQATITLATSTGSNQTLTVSDLGTGNGTVTDDLGQINCIDTAGVITGTCSASYSMGSIVNLTATIGDSTAFGGWGGACSGNTTCSVTMNSAQAVTASFAPTPTSITLNFTTSPTPQTQTAVFDCPSNTNPCTDPNAHALDLTVQSVIAPFSVTVTATEIPPSQADGNCETGNNVTNDFDCRFVSFFPGPIVSSGQLEPLCDPYAAGNCVHYNIFSGSVGQEPPTTSYTGPVNWQITWNNDTFVPPQPTYQTTPRLFDDPDYGVSETTPYGTSCTSPMLVGITNPQPTNPNIFCQFEFDITTFFNASEPVDSGIGGTTRQFNDVVVAFPLTIASPNLSLSKTADSTSVSVGSTVGFTVSVSNSTAGGTGSASTVALNDPLPAGAGVNWSINPAYTGPGTCAISGGVGAQILNCSFGSLAPAIGASVHISSSTTTNGTLSNTATVTATNNATLTASATINVGTAEFFPSFSNLTASQSIAAGTASITLSGTISAGENAPPSSEFVTITIDGMNVSAGIGTGGNFTTQFQTSAIPASATPYTITYNYAGDSTFASATDTSTTLTVTGSTSSTLNITLLGSGTGGVSDDDDIECSEANGVTSGDCSGTFGTGSMITLTASVTQPSTFIGWGGACASQTTNASCMVTVSGVTNVTANFAAGPQSATVTFNPGANVTQSAAFNCPTGDDPCADPNAHSLQLMVPTVLSPFQVTITATEVPPNQANGDCSPNNTVLNDFDCRFSTFFTFGTAPDGGMDVPLCDPYANGNCVFYSVYYCVPQTTGPCVPTRGMEPPPADYTGGVNWLIAWNDDTFVPPSLYTTPPRLYDDPDYAPTPTSAVGTNCNIPMTINGVNQSYSCQFEFDITTQFFPGQTVDSGIGGTTRQFNDVVVAFPPANVPQLQASSAPDNPTVAPGSPIGFTVTVTNNGSAAASNVTVNDPLPSGTGVNWSISTAVTGCSITGSAPNQVLGCTFASVAVGQTISIHVTSATAASGTYTNVATITISGQQLLTIATVTVNAPATTTFTNLTPSQSITYGAASIPLAGTISAGSQFPPTTESVSITINGVTMTTPILANGNFQATFPTATIPGSSTPYPITYSYAGDANYASVTNSSTTLTVNAANQTISLTGAPASEVFGGSFPISATATSGLTVTVAPTGGCSVSGNSVTMTSGTTSCVLTATQSGNGNYNAATPVVVTVLATKANSTTTITSSPNPSTVGQTITVNFKVTGTGGTPTGSATVTATLSSATVTCTGTLTSGAGSCTVTLSTAGSWTINAAYSGDTNFATSTSGNLSQVVNSATSTLKFSPATLNFGTLYPGQVQFEFLTLTNTGSQMITFSNFSIASVSGADSNGFFGVSFCPHTLNAGKSCTIVMGFSADSNATKPHAATLVVTDNAPLSPQTVPMTATVINPIAHLSANSLNFGNQKVGTTSATQTVTITSAGTTPLTITSFSASGDFADASGTSCTNNMTLAPGSKCMIAVTFTPAKTGNRSGALTIVDNAENSPQQVSLSGTGK